MSFQDILIPDLINNIAYQCDIDTITKLAQTKKEISDMIDKNIIIEKIKEIFPKFFHKYINFNSKYLVNAKHMDIPNKCSFTGYIDFIQLENFVNDNYKTNILYGYDNYSRFYISILYRDLIINNIKIVTFFQRYIEQKSYFVSCQHTFISSTYCATWNFRYTDQTLTEYYDILFQLINEGIANYNNKHGEKFYYQLE